MDLMGGTHGGEGLPGWSHPRSCARWLSVQVTGGVLRVRTGAGAVEHLCQ